MKWTIGLLGTLAVLGCDDGSGSKSAAAPSASSAPPAPPPPSAPPPPTERPFPTITLGDRTFTVDGEELPWDKLELRLKGLESRKSEAENKDVSIVAIRTAPAHRVAEATAALHGVWHPKSLTVRTMTRDQAQGEIVVAPPRPHAQECSAVVFIEKDSSVALWTKGGGGAARFARGMAGPDLTASTEALRKRAASCDSAVWFLAAADSVNWGLAFDLALRAKVPDAALPPFRPTETVLPAHSPVPGRALKED